MNGTINAIDDVKGNPGAGIYVNGNIKNEDNSPIINLNNNTNITSTGNGIYAAGYATYNINGAHIEGQESGLGIKSGIFNIQDGTILGTGTDKTPTSGNNNGINASGTAIQIESNPNYKGKIELNIEDGTIESKNSNVIYEYTVNNSQTKVKKINLSGGTYKSNTGKAVLSFSDSFKSNHQNFISGGIYSSNPTDYLKDGYSIKINSTDEFEVINVFNENKITKKNNNESNNNNNPLNLIIIVSSLSIVAIVIFLNRKKIFY